MAHKHTSNVRQGLDTCQAILERVAVMLTTYNELVKDEGLPIPTVSFTHLAMAYHGIDQVRGHATVPAKLQAVA